jgi:hypothetical protein
VYRDRDDLGDLYWVADDGLDAWPVWTWREAMERAAWMLRTREEQA